MDTIQMIQEENQQETRKKLIEKYYDKFCINEIESAEYAVDKIYYNK